MSLFPRHLSIPTIAQFLLGSLAIALLTSCQDKPTANPSIAPTATSTAAPVIPQETDGTLERVKQRGKLICGVNGKLPGFSYVDERGDWSGLDVDYCRAIAAAVLGDAAAIDFKPLLAKDRFTAIQTGEVDVLMRNTPRTLTRDVINNIAFAPTTFFDGQGIMLRISTKSSDSPNSSATPSPIETSSTGANSSDSKTEANGNAKNELKTEQSPSINKDIGEETSRGVKAATGQDNSQTGSAERSAETLAIALKDLSGKKICVETGNNANNLESNIAESKVEVEAVVLADLENVLNAYAKGECDAVSSEKSQLAAWRSKLPRPADHKILDLNFSKEPFSPALVGNDDRWRDVVTWVIYATFYAEELGISQTNYNIFKDTKNLEVSKFLGTSDSLGIELGLAPDWTTQILKSVGNYDDIYSRNIAPLDIPRGLNRSWKQGGLLYSMPFR
jgi:general L-amino acid transport system substrate-binding protein